LAGAGRQGDPRVRRQTAASTPPSKLAVTNINFFTPAAIGNKGAPLTLNYLCATNNDLLPDTTHAGFGWNWIEANEASQYDGVAALSRTTFAKYLIYVLSGYVARNCYVPSVRVTYKGGIKIEVEYQWGMSAGHPTIVSPASGGTIVSCSYRSGTASDQAGYHGDAGKMELSSSFDLSVSVQGNKMTIVQHLVVWSYVRYLATDASGNILDKQITDTYTFGVDDKGQIVVSAPASATVDHSRTPGANDFLNFWANVDNLANSVAEWSRNCIGTRLTDIPAAAVQSFVFPGGSTFSFADVSFSENQDLVAHITYADVS
jgi:hypothetical protein